MSMRRSYTAAEKLKVVRYVEAHGNRAAGREFDGIWNLQLATLEKSNPMYNMQYYREKSAYYIRNFTVVNK